jgi:catalase
VVQIAGAEDEVDNSTVVWPADRELIEFGEFTLSEIIDGNEPENKKIIFDPIPRVKGIEPSEDPLLNLRAAIYLISGRRRRAESK